VSRIGSSLLSFYFRRSSTIQQVTDSLEWLTADEIRFEYCKSGTIFREAGVSRTVSSGAAVTRSRGASWRGTDWRRFDEIGDLRDWERLPPSGKCGCSTTGQGCTCVACIAKPKVVR